MGTIKTAISIDSRIFNQVDRLSHRLHISRSRFFAQAATYMIKRDENLELLKKINSACDHDEDVMRRKHEKKYTRKKVVEKW